MSESAYDIAAEQSLLGLAMMFPDKCEIALLTVEPDDWWQWRHRDLASVIQSMLRSGLSVDPTTVLGQVTARGWIGKIDGAWILSLAQLAWRPESASDLARRVRELSGRRKLSAAAQRLTQRLESGWESGDDTDVASAVAEIRVACEVAESVVAEKSLPIPQTMGAFLSEPDTHDWLIPGMLERSERIVLTGAEGGGKSVLCSQLAACMAGGVHPFTADPLGNGTHGIRVLVIDCENSPAQSRRRYRSVIKSVDAARQGNGYSQLDWSESMFIDMRPAGIDLLGGRDVAWLEHAISSTAPDLLVLGPLYKLHHQNPSDETAARELVWVLDGLRERYGFALLTEAHAGNSADPAGDRQMRPIGSSLFRRWPEFGFGLRRAKSDKGGPRAELVDVVSWRGSREERSWPQSLQHSHILPWMPADPEYFDEIARIPA
ncbi:AAA family ATPase [Rhodococcus sp. Leaf233]|uniref:AAA family ATPase n=1 Tax=Rhodococcus sp. Leaf233 TaxID=1736302 RepID=UPI00070A5F1F|nr:AAA family ATPase [Rhodococcus sp. Leaf233]KQU33541.1 hypothetical protein ASH04_06820 [Rhodococcus sp. Leaf233]